MKYFERDDVEYINGLLQKVRQEVTEIETAIFKDEPPSRLHELMLTKHHAWTQLRMLFYNRAVAQPGGYVRGNTRVSHVDDPT